MICKAAVATVVATALFSWLIGMMMGGMIGLFWLSKDPVSPPDDSELGGTTKETPNEKTDDHPTA